MKRGIFWLVLATLCVLCSVGCSSNSKVQPIYTQNYTFYLNGQDSNGLVYGLAGVVTIGRTASADGSFPVLGGEQDYNDGQVLTVVDDLLTGGKLVKQADGSAILTVVTTSKLPGVMGTETFAVFFSSADHALITEADGSATSSGSLDLQTLAFSTATPSLQSLPVIPSGPYAFVAYGADVAQMPIVYGGVWTVDPMTAAVSGTLDVNDAGVVVTGTPIAAGPTFMQPDSLGRGIVMSNPGIGTSPLVYYLVNVGAMRIIDVDTTDTAVGSAYFQGFSTNFGPASIGTSVFSIGSSLGLYAAAGQFSTVPGSASFSGVGDENESLLNGNPPEIAESIGGTYTLQSSGYGSLTFTNPLGSMSTLGVYAVDPNVNIADPNNLIGTGGALIAEMDSNLVGVGSIVPETDTGLGAFIGAYVFGGQADNGSFDEFDFAGIATISSTSFNGTGALSDPFGAITEGVDTGAATFKATVTPDPSNVGRYTLNPIAVGTTASNFAPFNFNTVTAYQAYGGLLFWVEVDDGRMFLGSLQQNQ